jgi:hypothetical protein
LQLERLETGSDILIAPFQQDAFLIGAGADDEAQSCRILRLLDRGDRTISLDEEAMQTFAVGREIELFLALFGNTDVGNNSIIFA